MNGVPSRAALLALCLAMFSFLACSPEEARQPDMDESPGEGIRVGGGGPFPRGRGGGEPVARTRGRVAIDRAVLNSAGDADLIHVRVECRSSWVWPRCSLLEGPAVETVRGTIGRRDPPRAEGFTRSLWTESLWAAHESPWANRRAIEKFIEEDGSVLWVFPEDPAPDDSAADPRRTPFYVRCTGGEQPEIVHDVAHVTGTPTSILKLTPLPRGEAFDKSPGLPRCAPHPHA